MFTVLSNNLPSLRNPVSVFKMACDKLLDVVGGLVPPNQIPTKTLEDQGRIKTKARKGEITV